ncbi:hypothetical protein ACFE04_026027 [Oxalis oulophora]
MIKPVSILLLLIVVFLKCMYIRADPTDGFTQLPLTNANFKLQKPYNMPLHDRYNFTNGIRSFRVYNHDKPFKTDTPTRPRTEARIQGYDYSSGIHQFEGYAYVPTGTSGVTIMQIFGGTQRATTMQLRIYGGNLRYYNFDTVATGLYDRWFRVNVIHNVGEGKITVFIDGYEKFKVNDRGPGHLYFKFGVYAAKDGSSNLMQSRWKNIKLFKK